MDIKSIKLSPGYFLCTEFSSRGGTHYQREVVAAENVGEGERVDFRTVKTVDHISLQKRATSIVQHAYRILKANSIPTPLGPWIEKDAFAKMMEQLNVVQDNAVALCKDARDLGSERRVSINIYPMCVAEDNTTAARRIAHEVRDRLTALQEAFQSGNYENSSRAYEAIQGLERMATGVQRDAITLAQDHAFVLLKSLYEKVVPTEVWVLSADVEPFQAARQLFECA